MNFRKFVHSKLFRPAAILCAAVLAFLIFLAVFYVPSGHAEVVGNTRYTAGEIRQMIFDSFKNHNSLYLALMKKTVRPSDAPFVDSIDVEYAGHNRVILHVNENNPVGYIEQEGKDYYFDAQGVVLEAMDVEGWTPEAEESVNASSGADSASSSSSEAVSSSSGPEETPTEPLVDLNGDGIYDTTAEGTYLVDSDGDDYPDTATDGTALIDTDGDGIPDASPAPVTPTPTPEPTDTPEPAETQASSAAPLEAVVADSSDGTVSSSSGGALSAVMQTSSDTEFHPALTDVTMVTGLTEEPLSVGKKVPVEDDSVFSTILALSKIISKLDIKPDSLAFDKDLNMTLHYGDIEIRIGRDTLLEEKMSRVAAILPQLESEGLKGTLHLENFSEDTVNIVFDRK